MPTVIKADFSQVDRLFEQLRTFQNYGVHDAVDNGAKKLVSHLKTNISHGKDASGGYYQDVKQETMDSQIAYGGPFRDTRIRGNVSSNRTPFNVTGQTIDSLYHKRSGNSTEIIIDDPRSVMILQSNAKGSGGVPKPKRDPLGLNLRNTTDIEFDLIADAVEKAIDRIVSGL